MPEPEPRREAAWQPLCEAGVAAAGMCLFALFVHQDLPLVLLSACGLLGTLFAFYSSLRLSQMNRHVPAYAGRAASPPFSEIFGLSFFSRRVGVCSVFACILGAAFAVAYRNRCGWALMPHALGPFAAAAALIGAAEELVYRGYVQGRVRRLGVLRAVAFAALCHTAYKCALFVMPGVAADTNFAFIIRWTLLGGMAFGALRELGGSVVPPLVAHALFDILVYGEYEQAPWWVWS